MCAYAVIAVEMKPLSTYVRTHTKKILGENVTFQVQHNTRNKICNYGTISMYNLRVHVLCVGSVGE